MGDDGLDKERAGASFTDADIDSAHRHTFANEPEILRSSFCTCMYCGHHFQPSTIDPIDWWEEEGPQERTLACPECGIDAVLGDASGFPVSDPDFIRACTENWFSGYSRISDRLKQKPS